MSHGITYVWHVRIRMARVAWYYVLAHDAGNSPAWGIDKNSFIMMFEHETMPMFINASCWTMTRITFMGRNVIPHWTLSEEIRYK